MVVPFCVASLWMAMRFVPVTAPGGVAANASSITLDWRGLLLASVSTLCLLNGMVMPLLKLSACLAPPFLVW